MARRIGSSILDNEREMFKLFNDNADGEGNQAVRKIAKKALKKVVEEQLSARQKQFIVLYYYKEMNIPEIAEMCGVNVSTVCRTLNRARQNIYKYMKYYFN